MSIPEEAERTPADRRPGPDGRRIRLTHTPFDTGRRSRPRGKGAGATVFVSRASDRCRRIMRFVPFPGSALESYEEDHTLQGGRAAGPRGFESTCSSRRAQPGHLTSRSVERPVSGDVLPWVGRRTDLQVADGHSWPRSRMVERPEETTANGPWGHDAVAERVQTPSGKLAAADLGGR